MNAEETLYQYGTEFMLAGALFILFVGYHLISRLEAEQDRKLELLIGIPTAISVILVAYNLILSTHSNKRIEENRAANTTLENIQRNWLSPQIELSKFYPESHFLYRSMTPESHYVDVWPQSYDPSKRAQIEVVYSFRVFQAMEDYLTIGAHDLTGQYVYINNYLMWMQSDILRRNWSEISFNFSSDTREMIDRLITQSDRLIAKRKRVGKLSADDYDSISKNFEVHYRTKL
ncbi:hypothetical protein BFP72_07635 [Reichenbachiella sp. 5M10]|uniref:hypothetical protein n=1 Tax=Reichenbachiella sp. 5M10 TaxID=1889772 RepID=UPI000C153F1E|nr:hypothetical protein [Reichenbachiella sp. 5M10]PIB35278.1 hypothetical protein BFP72_07635 [Reichenbachiella sp. 5M10]